MKWRLTRPIVDMLTGHWISMTGTALVTLASFSWLFLLPMHISGHADSPYIGLLTLIALPMLFFTGLALIPIGAALGRRRIERGLALVADRRTTWRRAGVFFGVMTAANLVIGSQLSNRSVTYMETVQFCGQTCHVMKPEFTAHLLPAHAQVECTACHVASGATGFIKAKMAGTRQLLAVVLNNYPRPIESAMESNRLVPSAETCEQCHQREKPMRPQLRVIREFNSDEDNAPAVTVLMMMTDKIHAAHLAPGVAIRYAAADKARQTIPWVERRNASGAVKTFLAEGTTPRQAAAMPKFEMQCVDCHNRPAHSFETPGRAIDGALAGGQIAPDLPFIRKTGLDLIQAKYGSDEEAFAKIASGLNDFYRQKYPDVFAKRSNDVTAASRALSEIYSRNVFPDLKVTWGTYPNNLGHADYPGCFRCHDGSHSTTAKESLTQDCTACHNLVAVQESSPKILETLGLPLK